MAPYRAFHATEGGVPVCGAAPTPGDTTATEARRWFQDDELAKWLQCLDCCAVVRGMGP